MAFYIELQLVLLVICNECSVESTKIAFNFCLLGLKICDCPASSFGPSPEEVLSDEFVYLLFIGFYIFHNLFSTFSISSAAGLLFLVGDFNS